MHIPIGVEHEITGIVDVLHMCAYMSPEGQKEASRTEIPAELADQAAQYREKLLDAVVETDEGLMERYLDGQELSDEEVAKALKDAVTRGEVFPVAAAVATKNLGTTAVLDLIVEGVPSPAKKGAPIEIEGAATAAFVFKTIADPFAGRINVFRVLKGTITTDTTLTDTREHAKERMGTLLSMQGKDHVGADAFGEGDIGAVAKLKDVKTGDLLLDKEVATDVPALRLPGAGDELRDHAEGQGRGGEARPGAPAADRGGPDAASCAATSRPASSSSPGFRRCTSRSPSSG